MADETEGAEGDSEDFYQRSHSGEGFWEGRREAYFSPPFCLGLGVTCWDRGLLSLLMSNSLLQASFASFESGGGMGGTGGGE